MAQLIQYVLSTGHIRGVYEATTLALVEAQIVAGDPVNGYLVSSVGSEVDIMRQQEYEVLAGVLTHKTLLTITATPSPFVADGIAECAITVAPFVACTIEVNGVATALTTGDPTLLLTADAAQRFQVRLPSRPGYFAAEVTIWAVDPDEAILHATGNVSIVGTSSPTLAPAQLSSAGQVSIQGAAAMTLTDATMAATTTLMTFLTAALTSADAQLSSEGTVALQATSSLITEVATMASTGTLAIQGSVNVVAEAVTLTSTGTLPIQATAALSGAPTLLTAQGTLPIVGTAELTLETITLESSGSPPLTADLNVTLDEIILMSEGAA